MTIYIVSTVYNIWYLLSKTILAMVLEYQLADNESKINKAIMVSLLTVDCAGALLLVHTFVKFHIGIIISYNALNVFLSFVRTIYLVSYIVATGDTKAMLLLVVSINDILFICSAVFYHEYSCAEKIFNNNSEDNLNMLLGHYGKKISEGVIGIVDDRPVNEFRYHLEGFKAPISPQRVNPHNQFYQQRGNQQAFSPQAYNQHGNQVEGQSVP